MGIFLEVSFEEDFDEIDFQSDGYEFLVSGRFLRSNVKPEVVVHDVVDLYRQQVKYIVQNRLNLLRLINHVFVDIVTTTNFTELVHNELHKSINHFQFVNT
jgi:hypothetical protein